jgi:surface antigen/peptidoglycan hydrolase CwlO-like protein
MIGGNAIPTTRAQSIDDEIRALQQQNSKNKAAVLDLMKTATSYQNAIGQLEGQINELQAQINANLARQADLQNKIEEGQRELERQRGILGADIKAMYVDGEISTIEMLATSKNLSDFIDKEAYRNAVQNKIQQTLRKIAALQEQLKAQKAEVETLLAQQQSQQASLNESRSEQTRMLSLNKAQQAEFNKQTKSNQARIDDLIAQQRRANQGPLSGVYFIRFPGAIGDHDVTIDDYPYKNDGFSMQLGPCSFSDSYPDHPDRWGYCTRQCVSYAAWAVERSGRAAPMYYGSAKNWVYAAPASWIHRDPQPGDVAITTGGTWGHAMYVEQVDGNRIYVSQYNSSLDGEYSTAWRTFR